MRLALLYFHRDIFRPDGYDKSLAEMTLEEENAISHRAKAFRQLRTFFEKLKS
ncbi:MAG: non-canonical purine NTP pyrophosphatase [bacterium]|nr:non-canonical purine NTP pyrophosphatase [bacterium]